MDREGEISWREGPRKGASLSTSWRLRQRQNAEMLGCYIYCGFIPFAAFYYEADDDSGLLPSVTGETSTSPKPRSRLSQALCNLTVLVVIVTLSFFLAYWFLAYSHVTVQTYNAGTIYDAALLPAAGVIFQSFPKKRTRTALCRGSRRMTYKVSKPTMHCCSDLSKGKMDLIAYGIMWRCPHFTADMTFIGWFFFALFVKRERDDKSKTSSRQGLLASLFPTFCHKRSSTLREFKAAVFLLEEDVRDFTAYQITSEKYNPLYPYFSLLMGFVSFVFSFCWFLHTVLYTLPSPPVTKFLNELFEWLDSWFPLFGTLSVAFATLYLLLCAVQGCFVFGMRFLCLSFYPMKVGLSSSMLAVLFL